MTQIKFCGLTTAEDAAHAGALGADYAGVIFAGGPRTLEPSAALEVLLGTKLRRVGVFGASEVDEIARIGRYAELDVIQLHADPAPEFVSAVREATLLEIWAVIRTAGKLPSNATRLFETADAVVLDARSASGLGGTGTTLPWEAIQPEISAMRGNGRLILAGGLTPENVSSAIAVLAPDVVDVSSGVEQTPGKKNPARMRAFADAVRAASPARPVATR